MYDFHTKHVQERYMIVVVGGIKGGSGKTTLATNLTVLRSKDGAKVLLVDADEQKSTSDWAAQRASTEVKTKWCTIQLSGKTIYEQLEMLGPDYDDIIVDVGGRNTSSLISSLVIADVFLIPFRPRSLDIWTIGEVTNVISQIKAANPGLKSIAVINQADSRGSDNEDALEILRECKDLDCFSGFIGERKAFSNAAASGLGVIELEKQDTRKAVQELRELYEYLFAK